MCDPKPGARCSAGTQKELEEALSKLARAKRNLDRQPEDAAIIREFEKANSTMGRKVAAYDSSPRGQADLVGEISRLPATSASAVADALRSRLFVGRATRVEQKKALARAQGGSDADQAEAAAKVLSRLRHPDKAIHLHEGQHREDALGFFVPAKDPDRASAAGRGDGSGVIAALVNPSLNKFEVVWRENESAQVVTGVATKWLSAESARAAAERAGVPLFYDAQTGLGVAVRSMAVFGPETTSER